MITTPKLFLLACLPLIICSCKAPRKHAAPPPQRLRIGMELNESLEVCRLAGLKPHEMFNAVGGEEPVTEVREFQIDRDGCKDGFYIGAYRCDDNETFTVSTLGWRKNWKADSVLPKGKRKGVFHWVTAIDITTVIAYLEGNRNEDETEETVRSADDAIDE